MARPPGPGHPIGLPGRTRLRPRQLARFLQVCPPLPEKLADHVATVRRWYPYDPAMATRIAWVEHVHPARGARLRAGFDRITWADDPSAESTE